MDLCIVCARLSSEWVGVTCLRVGLPRESGHTPIPPRHVPVLAKFGRRGTHVPRSFNCRFTVHGIRSCGSRSTAVPRVTFPCSRGRAEVGEVTQREAREFPDLAPRPRGVRARISCTATLCVCSCMCVCGCVWVMGCSLGPVAAVWPWILPEFVMSRHASSVCSRSRIRRRTTCQRPFQLSNPS